MAIFLNSLVKYPWPFVGSAPETIRLDCREFAIAKQGHVQDTHHDCFKRPVVPSDQTMTHKCLFAANVQASIAARTNDLAVTCVNLKAERFWCPNCWQIPVVKRSKLVHREGWLVIFDGMWWGLQCLNWQVYIYQGFYLTESVAWL